MYGNSIGTFFRAFIDGQSIEIEGKYVYVYAVDATVGPKDVQLDTGTLTLAQEVYAKGGKLFPINLKGNKGLDQRPHEEYSTDCLILDLIASPNAKQKFRFYYFHLAPFQLSWGALQDLSKNILDRGACLFDPFHTRICPRGDWAAAQPLLPPPAKVESPSYVMHLIDPFKEALVRAARLAQALDQWHEAQAKLGQVPTYRLAKWSELFAKQTNHSDLISWRHTSTVIDLEQNSMRLCMLCEMLAADCVLWLGREQHADKMQQCDYFLPVGGGKLNGFKSKLPAGQSFNAFGQAAIDYYLYDCTEDQLYQVGQLIFMATARLRETSVGQDWLEENFNKHYDGPPAKDDGGLGFAFWKETKRVQKEWKSLHKWAKGAVGFVTNIYTKQWVKKQTGDALENVATYFKAKTGIDLELVRPRAVRRALISETRGEWRRAVRAYNKGKDVPQLKFAERELSQMVDKLLAPLTMAVEAVNAAVAIEKFREKGDSFELLRAINSLAKAYEALGKLNAAFKVEGSTYEAFGAVAKIKPLSVATNLVDVVLSTHDAFGASNTQGAFGHSMKAVGSAIAVAGAFTSETGVGAVVGIIGVIIQQGGEFIASQSDDSKKFFAYYEWGEPGLLDKAFTSYWWCQGDAIYLKGNLPAQERCIHELWFNYKPIIVREGPNSRLELGALAPGLISMLLTREHEWDVELNIREPAGWNGPFPPGQTIRLSADDLVVEQHDRNSRVFFPLDLDSIDLSQEWMNVDVARVTGHVNLSLPLVENGNPDDPFDTARLKRAIDQDITLYHRTSPADPPSAGTPDPPSAGTPDPVPAETPDAEINVP